MSFILASFLPSSKKEVTVQTLDNSSLQLVHLNLSDDLLTIRKELEKDDIINDTLLFSKKIPNESNKFAEIKFKKEKEFILSDIIDRSENAHILYLKFCPKPNWRVLKDLRKLEFGCTMTFNGIEKANKKASIMKNCELTEFDAGGCQIGDVEFFSSDEDRFMKTNLFFNINISDVKKFVELGMSVGKSKNETFKSKINTTCYYTIYKKVTLKFGECLEASPEFIKEVEEAIKSKDTESIRQSLRQITGKFGQFVPTEVIMGGKACLDDISTSTKHATGGSDKVSLRASTIVLKAGLTNNSDSLEESSKSYKSRCKSLIGGEQPDSLEIFDEIAWIRSLKTDYRNWDSIEFRNPVSIFQLLPFNLRKQVIEIVGKRIHYLKFEDFDYKEEFGTPNIFELKNMPSNISKMIQNKDADCNIFATVDDVTGSKNNFFTWQVLHLPNSKPSLLIHCIQKKKFKKREHKLRIGWMVIGYYIDFSFMLSDYNAQLKILKKDFNLSTPTMFKKELLDFKYNRFPPCLGIPVLNNLDNRSLVIGHHFFNAQEEGKIGTCTFSYCVKNKHYINLPKFTFYTLIISNYPISNAFGNQLFKKKDSSSTKYISLYSTKETNVGPIFLCQKSGQIEIKHINCKLRACFICNERLSISEKNAGYAYFDPNVRTG